MIAGTGLAAMVLDRERTRGSPARTAEVPVEAETMMRNADFAGPFGHMIDGLLSGVRRDG